LIVEYTREFKEAIIQKILLNADRTVVFVCGRKKSNKISSNQVSDVRLGFCLLKIFSIFDNIVPVRITPGLILAIHQFV